MKDQKLNPDEGEEEDRETVADRFYKKIISGNSREFIQSSMSQYDNGNQFQGFNLSQPSSFTTNPIEYIIDAISLFDILLSQYIKRR